MNKNWIFLWILFVFLFCKEEAKVEIQDESKIEAVKENAIDQERLHSFFNPNPIEQIDYSKGETISLAKFKEKAMLKYEDNGLRYLVLDEFEGKHITQDQIAYQSSNSLSFHEDEKKNIKVDFQLDEPVLENGTLQNIKCIEFSEKLKDCKITIYENEAKREGFVILKIKNDNLYRVISVNYSSRDFIAYKLVKTLQSPETFLSFKKAFQEYRKEKFGPPIESFEFNPEFLPYYEE